jgi:hypothetical protein
VADRAGGLRPRAGVVVMGSNLGVICLTPSAELKDLSRRALQVMAAAGYGNSQDHRSFIWQGQPYSIWNKGSDVEIWTGVHGSVRCDSATTHHILSWLLSEAPGGLGAAPLAGSEGETEAMRAWRIEVKLAPLSAAVATVLAFGKNEAEACLRVSKSPVWFERSAVLTVEEVPHTEVITRLDDWTEENPNADREKKIQELAKRVGCDSFPDGSRFLDWLDHVGDELGLASRNIGERAQIEELLAKGHTVERIEADIQTFYEDDEEA